VTGGHKEGGGTRVEASDVLRVFQAVWSQLGVGEGGRSRGAESNIVMGTWSDPVEGSVASLF